MCAFGSVQRGLWEQRCLSSLRLGEAGRSECASLGPRTLSVCPGDGPSPTQDVSYSQGQPRVRGKQGLGQGGTREGDVTPTLSNALAEPEAPTLGGREEGGGAGLELAARRLPSR